MLLTFSLVAQITHGEDTDRLTNDPSNEENTGQGIDPEGADSRMLQQSLTNQTYGNTLTMPVVIPMQGNDNPSNIITTQLPGIVSSTVHNPYYSNRMIGTYSFSGNNAMAFSSDLSSGTIIIFPHATAIYVTHHSYLFLPIKATFLPSSPISNKAVPSFVTSFL